MSRDDDVLIDLDELESVLRSHQGPPRARPLSRRAPSSPRRNRPRRLLWTGGVAVVALLAGSSLGFGLGSSVTPSGGAAEAPAGLGFLPERGWHVVRSRFEATPVRPSFAIASNVPLVHLDARMSGRVNFSGHPYRTLQSLQPDGVVLVASFALRGVHTPSDESFPRRALPLRLRDASSEIRPSYYGPRARPLGWYELRAAVGEHNVIVSVYFGTLQPTKASIIAAQRQLDRLVVGSTRPAAHVDERALPLRPSTGVSAASGNASRLVDRTFVCNPVAYGGVGDLDMYVTPPRDRGFGRREPAYLMLLSGSNSPDSMLVLVRARFQAELSGLAVPWAPGPEGVYGHARRCASIRKSVPLSSRGLPGPPVRFSTDVDCSVRGRVLVRVRAVLQKSAEWRRADRTYVGARSPVIEARLAVRVQRTGKPIAYMELNAKGGTKLWYSSPCG